MLENFIAFFIIIAGGTFFRRKRPGGIDPDAARHTINTVVIRFFLPAMCFKVIASCETDINTVLLPLSAILTILVSLAISFAVYSIFEKFFSIEKKEKAVFILAASFGNVTFLGLPLLTGLYGKDAVKYVILYDLLATTPLLWLVGASIASAYGNGKKLSVKESLNIFFKLPPVWGLILGFAANFTGLEIPSFFIKTFDLLSMPIVPMMIFSVGLALELPKIKETAIALPAVIIKLCVAPLAAFAITTLFAMEGLALKSSVTEAAMPSMALTLAIASQFKLDHKLAALTIVFTTASSFITIPVVRYLLR